VASMPTPYKFHVVVCETFDELQKAFDDNCIRLGFYFYGVYQLVDKVALVFACSGAKEPRVPTMKELKKELAEEFVNRDDALKVYGCEYDLLSDFLEWIQKQGFTIAIL